jgi:hypothetical protein
MIQRQEAEIRELRDEIHKLKGTTRRPKIKPSKLLKPRPLGASDQQGRRPGSDKRHKTVALPIHEDLPLVIEGLPSGTQSEGYRDFVVQDLRIEAHNTRYRRTVYRLPDGSLQVASLPAHVEGHFGVRLRQYVLYQVHQNHVTQGRLLQALRELGIDISAGQISAILLAGHEAFHAEKDALLPTARQISGYLHCDDTSARHRGHNAVCTHIGNELFASFHSTDSKSRLNFLQLLCLPEERYTWCEEAVQCLDWLGAGVKLQRRLTERQRQAKESVQEEYWQLYDRLKAYRLAPAAAEKTAIVQAFAHMCRQKTGYPALNEALSLLHAKQTTHLIPPLAEVMRNVAQAGTCPAAAPNTG